MFAIQLTGRKKQILMIVLASIIVVGMVILYFDRTRPQDKVGVDVDALYESPSDYKSVKIDGKWSSGNEEIDRIVERLSDPELTSEKKDEVLSKIIKDIEEKDRKKYGRVTPESSKKILTIYNYISK